MTIADRKLREKDAMRKLILKAAMKLFLQEGYANVSIRRIADKIEYSPATIYLYFKDRDEILHALHNAGFEELFKRQQTAESISDPIERLKHQGEVYLRFALENPEYYDLMFIARGPVRSLKDVDEWNMGRRSYEYLRDNVQRCLDAGYFGAYDLDVVTFTLWANVHGIASLIVRNRCFVCEPAKLDNLTNDALELTHFMITSTKRK
jgi:AcrR family transcriptional regulator